jgi:predicted nucleotidyltransferase
MQDKWLKKFTQNALPQLIQEFQPEKIVLFGSRIKGDADEDSDIDVIIVSNAFAGIPFVKRMPLILKKIRFDKHIDFICYSPVEFQKIQHTSSVVMDALQYGESLEEVIWKA